VAKDPTEAARWYRKAAEQAVPDAEHALGTCLADGDGVPADHVEAYKWIGLAAAHGHKEAAIFLDVLSRKLTPEQLAKARQLIESALAKSPRK
jgi:uncharacterized protein